MFDWLKFFPLAERDDHNPSEVRGPYFPALRKRNWVLGDSRLHFCAPRANPIFSLSYRGRPLNAFSPGSGNVLRRGKTVNVTYDVPSKWDAAVFYSSTWYFVGPWFTGRQTSLDANALIVNARQGTEFTDKNLFHPRVFEGAIAGFLDNSHGYSRRGSKPRYRAPLNWQVLPISDSIHAVMCDVHFIGNGSKDDPQLHRRIYIPVTPQQFIQISFGFGIVKQLFEDEIRGKPLFALCDSIIDSLRLEVGANTKAEWEKVKATCPDMSITQTFGELPWPLIEPKKGKELDVTPAPAVQDMLEHRQEFDENGSG